jgi:hypothetical protein
MTRNLGLDRLCAWRHDPVSRLLRRTTMSKCRFCNSTSHGSGCSYSPHKKHEHVENEKVCEFCGSSSYGSGCSYSPTGKHRHGHGANKCIWCGSTSNGSGCSYSPNKTHEK